MARGKRAVRTRYGRKRRVRVAWAVFSILVIAGSMAYGIYYVSHIESLQISDIAVVGASAVPEEDVKSRIGSIIEGERLGGLVSKSFSFIFSEKNARAAVMDAIPRVASVDFEKKGYKTVEVKITERSPDSVVCRSVSPCFYADEDGFIYAEAPNLESGGLPKIVYAGGIVIEPGSAPFADIYSSLVGVISKVKSLGINTNSIKVSDADQAGYATYEIIVLPQGKIIMNDRTPFSESMDRLTLFWKNKNRSTFPDRFEYIDLRFGNNIVYK